MKYELRQLSFGETLGHAFNLYFDNFVPLFLISLVCNLPTIFFLHTMGISGFRDPEYNQTFIALIYVILSLSMITLCTALTIELISRKYLKQTQSFGEYFQNIIPFIFPIIGLTLLQGLIIGLGLLAFLIPGIYLGLALSVASQSMIVERKKVMESIRRSFFLTQGKKLEIFGYGLILFLIAFAIGLVKRQVYAMIAQMDLLIQTKLIWIYIIEHLSTILLTPVNSCVFILVYFNLRIDKEGFDLEHLVDQFGTNTPLTTPDDQSPMTNDQWQRTND